MASEHRHSWALTDPPVLTYHCVVCGMQGLLRPGCDDMEVSPDYEYLQQQLAQVRKQKDIYEERANDQKTQLAQVRTLLEELDQIAHGPHVTHYTGVTGPYAITIQDPAIFSLLKQMHAFLAQLAEGAGPHASTGETEQSRGGPSSFTLSPAGPAAAGGSWCGDSRGRAAHSPGGGS